MLGYKARLEVPSIPNWDVPIRGLNVPRSENWAVLYNSRQGKTTKSNQWGLELTVEKNRITRVAPGNSVIPAEGWVVSAHGQGQEMINYLEIGDEIKVSSEVDSKWDKAVHIVGAGPRLVEDGKVHVTSKKEAFPSDISVGRAPRTAIAELKDGSVWLVVVDGRSSSSTGMTLEELANYLVKLGVYNAMNLDGGGSSALVAKNEIRNSPSDGRERAVGSSLIVIAQ